jgi:hypothetical protein
MSSSTSGIRSLAGLFVSVGYSSFPSSRRCSSPANCLSMFYIRLKGYSFTWSFMSYRLLVVDWCIGSLTGCLGSFERLDSPSSRNSFT